MKSRSVIILVGNVCSPEETEKFSKWQTEVHFPQVLESPGCLGATLYRIMEPGWDVMGPRQEFPQYLTIYEFENEQAVDKYEKRRASSEWKAELIKTWGRDPHAEIPGASKQKGITVKWRVQYQMLGSRRK